MEVERRNRADRLMALPTVFGTQQRLFSIHLGARHTRHVTLGFHLDWSAGWVQHGARMRRYHQLGKDDSQQRNPGEE